MKIIFGEWPGERKNDRENVVEKVEKLFSFSSEL